MHLLNGSTIHRALNRETRLIHDLMHLKQHPAASREIVDRLYIRCLTRTPDESEWEVIQSTMPPATEKDSRVWKRWYDGVLWGLLNSSEFLLNH